jgi:hypothetical protein
MRSVLILAGLIAFLPVVSLGQMHGGAGVPGGAVHGAPMAAPSGHAAAAPGSHAGVAAPSARAGTVTHRAGAPTVVGGGGVRRVHTGANSGGASRGRPFGTLPGFSENSADVPGLGFDYPHLASGNNGRVGRGRDRFGNGFGFSGFLLSPGVVVEQVPVYEEQGAAEQAPAENGAEAETASVAPERKVISRDTFSGPEIPAAEYVFVRRDGGLLFAVAYSWDNGTLRYITREGLRRSVTQDSLDIDATQQFNEQRGLNFRSPA